MQVDIGDWLGRHVFTTGEYEPASSLLIRSLLRTGDTFVDVGANSGYYSLLAANCVGSSGRVIAFEPIPELANRVRRSVALNDMGQCDVFSLALSDMQGEATLTLGPPDHLGVSSLRAFTNGSGQLSVHTARLDELLSKDIPVAMIKIDVEGAESRVLAGASRTLDRWKPDIVVEVTPRFLAECGSSATHLCALLEPHGYKGYRIRERGLEQFDPLSVNGDEQFNALFSANANGIKERLPASWSFV